MKKNVKNKVLIYVVSQNLLLVNYHIDHIDAGLQVPGGTVEDDELPCLAAARELEEESGLNLRMDGAEVHEYGYYPDWDDSVHQRSSFLVQANEMNCECFSFTVSSGTLDAGIRLAYMWMPIELALRLLNAGHDISLNHFFGGTSVHRTGRN